MNAITVTDSPHIAGLKREFQKLDARVEDLKHVAGFRQRPEYQNACARKAIIAQEIFNAGGNQT